MSSRNSLLAILTILILSLSTFAHAQEEEATASEAPAEEAAVAEEEKPAEEVTTEEEVAEESAVEESEAEEAGPLGFSIGGFVDSSFFYDINSETGGFSLDQVQLIVDRGLASWATVHARIAATQGYSNDTTGVAAFSIPKVLELPEAFVTATIPVGSGLTFTFGKFYAPVGFELVDAPDMYQYSHALVFNYGIPGFFTGLMLDYTVLDIFEIRAYVSNGWDAEFNENNAYTGGGRLGFTPLEGLGFGLSAVYGAETEDLSATTAMLDFDLGLELIPLTTVGLEFNYGMAFEGVVDDNGDLATGSWMGGLVMVHVDFCDYAGITVRYDYFDDPDGLRLDEGITQTRQAIAVAPTFAIADGAGALVEYRMDISDEDIFSDAKGKATNLSHYVVFEMTYSF